MLQDAHGGFGLAIGAGVSSSLEDWEISTIRVSSTGNHDSPGDLLDVLAASAAGRPHKLASNTTQSLWNNSAAALEHTVGPAGYSVATGPLPHLVGAGISADVAGGRPSSATDRVSAGSLAPRGAVGSFLVSDPTEAAFPDHPALPRMHSAASRPLPAAEAPVPNSGGDTGSATSASDGTVQCPEPPGTRNPSASPMNSPFPQASAVAASGSAAFDLDPFSPPLRQPTTPAPHCLPTTTMMATTTAVAAAGAGACSEATGSGLAIEARTDSGAAAGVACEGEEGSRQHSSGGWRFDPEPSKLEALHDLAPSISNLPPPVRVTVGPNAFRQQPVTAAQHQAAAKKRGREATGIFQQQQWGFADGGDGSDCQKKRGGGGGSCQAAGWRVARRDAEVADEKPIMYGMFYPERYMLGVDCIFVDGVYVSRSRFENLGGSLMAKWYRSIRVVDTAEALGAWLERHGLPVFTGKARQRRMRLVPAGVAAAAATISTPATWPSDTDKNQGSSNMGCKNKRPGKATGSGAAPAAGHQGTCSDTDVGVSAGDAAAGAWVGMPGCQADSEPAAVAAVGAASDGDGEGSLPRDAAAAAHGALGLRPCRQHDTSIRLGDAMSVDKPGARPGLGRLGRERRQGFGPGAFGLQGTDARAFNHAAVQPIPPALGPQCVGAGGATGAPANAAAAAAGPSMMAAGARGGAATASTAADGGGGGAGMSRPSDVEVIGVRPSCLTLETLPNGQVPPGVYLIGGRAGLVELPVPPAGHQQRQQPAPKVQSPLLPAQQVPAQHQPPQHQPQQQQQQADEQSRFLQQEQQQQADERPQYMQQQQQQRSEYQLQQQQQDQQQQCMQQQQSLLQHRQRQQQQREMQQQQQEQHAPGPAVRSSWRSATDGGAPYSLLDGTAQAAFGNPSPPPGVLSYDTAARDGAGWGTRRPAGYHPAACTPDASAPLPLARFDSDGGAVLPAGNHFHQPSPFAGVSRLSSPLAARAPAVVAVPAAMGGCVGGGGGGGGAPPPQIPAPATASSYRLPEASSLESVPTTAASRWVSSGYAPLPASTGFASYGSYDPNAGEGGTGGPEANEWSPLLPQSASTPAPTPHDPQEWSHQHQQHQQRYPTILQPPAYEVPPRDSPPAWLLPRAKPRQPLPREAARAPAATRASFAHSPYGLQQQSYHDEGDLGHQATAAAEPPMPAGTVGKATLRFASQGSGAAAAGATHLPLTPPRFAAHPGPPAGRHWEYGGQYWPYQSYAGHVRGGSAGAPTRHPIAVAGTMRPYYRNPYPREMPPGGGMPPALLPPPPPPYGYYYGHPYNPRRVPAVHRRRYAVSAPGAPEAPPPGVYGTRYDPNGAHGPYVSAHPDAEPFLDAAGSGVAPMPYMAAGMLSSDVDSMPNPLITRMPLSSTMSYTRPLAAPISVNAAAAPAAPAATAGAAAPGRVSSGGGGDMPCNPMPQQQQHCALAASAAAASPWRGTSSPGLRRFSTNGRRPAHFMPDGGTGLGAGLEGPTAAPGWGAAVGCSSAGAGPASGTGLVGNAQTVAGMNARSTAATAAGPAVREAVATMGVASPFAAVYGEYDVDPMWDSFQRWSAEEGGRAPQHQY